MRYAQQDLVGARGRRQKQPADVGDRIAGKVNFPQTHAVDTITSLLHDEFDHIVARLIRRRSIAANKPVRQPDTEMFAVCVRRNEVEESLHCEVVVDLEAGGQTYTVTVDSSGVVNKELKTLYPLSDAEVDAILRKRRGYGVGS